MKNKKSAPVCVTAAFLCVAMIMPLLSCSESTNAETETTTAAVEEVITDENTPETEKKYSDSIAAQDFGGYVFNMANDSLSIEYYSALNFDELTGDSLNDAIYERNRRIEDKFNIKITCTDTDSVALVKNSVTAGTHDVDTGYILCRNVIGLLTGGYLMPINRLGNINMDNPYWDAQALKTVEINGNIFHGYLDISFDHYEGMATIFYSGQLLTDFALEDPFNLYKDGKWTMDRMYSMMQAVSADLNNDGKRTAKDDRLGFVGRDFEYLPMLYSSGVSLVELQQNGGDFGFVFNLNNEKLINVGQMINKMLCDNSLSYPVGDELTRTMFKEGRVLFYSKLLGDFRNLRDKEDDYGIISYPAFEENYDNPRVYVQNPYTITVPVDTEDVDRTGIILESLAADTYDNVLDVYFEKTVIGKGARDQNSAEMLRDMRSRRAFDLSYMYGFIDSAVSALGMAVKSGNYASTADRYAKTFNKTASNTIEKFNEALDY